MKTLALPLLSAALLLTGCDSDSSEPTSAPSTPAAPKAAPEANSDAPSGEAEAKAEDAPDPAAPESETPESEAPESETPEGEAPEPAAATNAAFFSVRDKGIVVLTDAGFSTIPGSENRFVAELLHGADGKLYGRMSSEIVEMTATSTTAVAELPFGEVGSVAGFDVGKDGAIWVIGTNGVGEFRDDAWTMQSKATVGLAEDFAVGIALDSTGEPWVATSSSLVHRKDGKWETGSLPRGKTKFLSQMGRGPDGEVYLSTYDRLFRLTGTPGQVKLEKGRYDTPGKFAFSASTYGVARSGLENASVFLPSDQALLYRGKKDLKVGTISAVAVDEQGRVWAAGDGGMAIAGPGEARVTWKSGAMEQVAGQVTNIMVMGPGPKLPEAGEIKRGGLRGRVMKDGAGVAGVKIELCESPDLIYTRTPCTGAPTHLRGKTDADGGFAFDDVPLGAYGIAVKSGRKWQITLGAALGTKMTEGAIYDIGSLQLE